MKRIIFILFAFVAVTLRAQDFPVNADGAYETKQVVITDSVSAQTLYDRAMIALSEWSSGKADSHLDYHDRDAATLIYKGIESVGFKNVFLGAGWQRHIKFSILVRCKDGRAQVTVTVPSIVFTYTANNSRRELSMQELVDYIDKSKSKTKQRGMDVMDSIRNYAASLQDNMKAALQKRTAATVDDDF